MDAGNDTQGLTGNITREQEREREKVHTLYASWWKTETTYEVVLPKENWMWMEPLDSMTSS